MRAGDLLEASRERMEGASAHAPSCGPSRHSGSKDAYSADPLHRLPHAAAPLSKDPPPEGVRPAPTSAPPEAPDGRNNLTSADQRRDPLLARVGGHAGGRPSRSFQGTDGRSLCTRPVMWTVPPLRVQRRIQCRPAASTATRCCALSKDPPPECRVPSSVGEAGRRPLQGDATVHTLSCFGLGGRATSADKTPIGGTGRSQQPHKR
ncbi:MAG: hypothetical protein WDW38_010108 [Sanguina aurantia]